MARALIGRTIRRLRSERRLTQQALAVRLGISASYLNLIEHDQRAVTASLLIKLGETLRVDLATLSGRTETPAGGRAARGLRRSAAVRRCGAGGGDGRTWRRPPRTPRARCWRCIAPGAWRARTPAASPCHPAAACCCRTRRRATYSTTAATISPRLKAAAEAIAAELRVTPAEMNHAIAERLRRKHGLTVTRAAAGRCAAPLRCGGAQAGAVGDLAARKPRLPHGVPACLLEARDAVEAVLADAAPSSTEAAMLIRVGLLNYVAGALLMPYAAFLDAAHALRHDLEALAARFGVSFEQACHRLSTLQRPGARGVPFFFVRVDPAGNVSKRFSAAGFPFARYGGSCPRWVVHTAFSQPGVVQVQVAELPDGAAFLCFARTVTRPARTWGDPKPTHVVAMGCGDGSCRRGDIR